MVKRWLKRLLHCRGGSRLVRQRCFLSALFLFTLLVIVARLETEQDLWPLEANTLVLQSGFPAAPFNSSTSSKLQGLHLSSHVRRSASSISSSRSSSSSSSSSYHKITPHLELASYVAHQKHKWLKSYYQPSVKRSERYPSCQKLIVGDEDEQKYGRLFMEAHERLEKPPSSYIEDTRNCSAFIQQRGFVMHATEEEREFPIAYSIMMYTGVEQAERLLRAIYRPHNYHCIHVDGKSADEVIAAMRAIAGCLPNVFIASKLNKVYWATWSSLEALIFCMRDLWALSRTWKYYINLTGQEFPLKTNLQLVQILKALNGSNIVDASTDPSRTARWYNNFGPPHGIIPYKGMVFMMACRGFVDYILHNPVAHDFLQWVRYTVMPDETYFPSLNHNPHLMVPGSYKGPPDTNALLKPYLARFVSWNTNWKDGHGRYNFRYPCYGKRVRSICIYGFKDLPALTSRKELFVNKLYADYQPLTYNCMEEWILNMTIAEYAGQIEFNTTFYSSLDIAKNKVV